MLEIYCLKDLRHDPGLLFDLYCNDMGSPGTLIKFYQEMGWVDLMTLLVLPELMERHTPPYLGSIWGAGYGEYGYVN